MLQLDLGNASCLLTLDTFPSLVLSLSSIHILRIESLIQPYELRIDSNPKRARARVNGRSRAGVPVSFPNLSPRVSILMRWRDI